jgi:methionyl-tRNA synthetase
VPVADPDPAVAADLDGLATRVAELLDRAELTTALDEIWQRVRRLNRYVEERAPWQLAKDPDAAGELDESLYSLAEGLRVLTLLLHPYLPDATGKLLAALGQSELELAAAEFGARPGGAVTTGLEPLFPKR